MAGLRIRTQLSILVAFLLVGTMLAGGYGLVSLKTSQQLTDHSLVASGQVLAAVESARSAQVAFKSQIHEFKNLLLRGHDQEQFDWYLANFKKGKETVNRDLDNLEAAMSSLGLSTDPVMEARRLHGQVVQDHIEALKAFEAGKVETAVVADRVVRGKDRLLDEKVAAIVQGLQQAAAARAEQLRQEAGQRSQRAILFLGALLGVLGMAAIGAAALVLRQLQRQLGGEPASVKAVAERIATGDLSAQVAVRPGDDHSAVHAMKKMSDALRTLVAQVAGAAQLVAHSSEQIAQGNTDLSQRTEEQATTIEETAAQLEELTVIVGRNAQQAQEASDLAQAAAGVAGKGGRVMDDVVATMSGISESSRRIADILGVMDGIAFQTNILALNAAVEAARAGEQGRGFGVVASEVRVLAQSSSAAAKEIRSLIADSVGRVRAGTDLVNAAGETMREIVSSVSKVSELIAGIAAAGREQSAGIGQINGALGQMEQVVQQNATLVEEAAAATESMKSQAAELIEAVAAFRLGPHAQTDSTQPLQPPEKLRLRFGNEGGTFTVTEMGPAR